MTDHVAFMTLPRSGPQDIDPRLTQNGFQPIISERTGCVSFWVQHRYDIGWQRLLEECREIARSMPDIKFVLLDEIGKTHFLNTGENADD